jgi:hypothetical protein
VVLELGVKSVNKEAWPLLQWAQGDEAAFHGVTNTVHQYSRASGFKSEQAIGIRQSRDSILLLAKTRAALGVML